MATRVIRRDRDVMPVRAIEGRDSSMAPLGPERKGNVAMRRMNVRLIIAGVVLLAIAAVFHFLMLSMAAKSNDPAAMMQTVGQVSGVAGGIAVILVIFGLIGRKV